MYNSRQKYWICSSEEHFCKKKNHTQCKRLRCALSNLNNDKIDMNKRKGACVNISQHTQVQLNIIFVMCTFWLLTEKFIPKVALCFYLFFYVRFMFFLCVTTWDIIHCFPFFSYRRVTNELHLCVT